MMCYAHWMKLPAVLRNEVWRTYRPGQEKTMSPSREYVKVARRVQDWIKEHYGVKEEKPKTQDPLWLLIDVSNLAWRAHHTTGWMSYEGKPTGVIFGVLRELRKLEQRFGSYRPVFCLDLGRPKRLDIYPAYKGNREMTPDRKKVRRQCDELRKEVLPAIGFKNVLAVSGYEADDLIAECCLTHLAHPRHRKVIVSGDKDLFQLLGPGTIAYIPTKSSVYTAGEFRDEYGIEPHQWAMVKALAGCKTDNIKGMKGVAEKTAIKLLTKTTPNTVQTALRNLPLVKLPYPGLPDVDLRDDETSDVSWHKVTRQYGIRSL